MDEESLLENGSCSAFGCNRSLTWKLYCVQRMLKKKKINKRNNIAICRPTSMNCTICCLSSDIVCMFNEDLTLLSNAQSVYWPQRNRVPQFRGRNLANWKYKYYRNYSIVLTNEIKRFSIYVLISESHLSKFSFNRKTKTNKYVHHG